MKIGYARVSTKDQNLSLQVDELTKVGCQKIFQEKITGATSDRPQLKKMLEQLRKGDVVVILTLNWFGKILSIEYLYPC